MKTKQIGRNQMILSTNHCDEILYSYDEPIAGWNHKLGWFKVSDVKNTASLTHMTKYLKHVTNCTVLSPLEIAVMFLQGE